MTLPPLIRVILTQVQDIARYAVNSDEETRELTRLSIHNYAQIIARYENAEKRKSRLSKRDGKTLI